jgi:hypothetical protein
VVASPLTSWLEDVDRLDFEAAIAPFSNDVRLLTTDGRRATGVDDVRALLGEFLSQVRAVTHEVTAQWHEDNVWIAEVAARYELVDYLQTSPLPRVFIMREDADGKIADLRVYGAHEQELLNHRTGGEGMLIGKRWIPPL